MCNKFCACRLSEIKKKFELNTYITKCRKFENDYKNRFRNHNNELDEKPMSIHQLK